MTKELQAEWSYRYTERLGILCGSAVPTPEQDRLAREEADGWVKDQEAGPQGELFESK